MKKHWKILTIIVFVAITLSAWALNYKNIIWADGDTTVSSRSGFLHTVIINKAATTASEVILWDNTTSTGTKIATIGINTTTNGQVAESLDYGCQFNNGLFVDVSATTTDIDITLVYR